jgi:hypothetical protein
MDGDERSQCAGANPALIVGDDISGNKCCKRQHSKAARMRHTDWIVVILATLALVAGFMWLAYSYRPI